MSDKPVKAAWLHHNPVRIIAGMGAISSLPELAPPGTVLLVTTPGSTRRGMTALVQSLLGVSRVIVHDRITPNPELDDLDAATAHLRGKDIQSIVALGGGSALDAGKVFSVSLPCGMPAPLDYVLRKGNSHAWQTSLPLVAIPTTAGTGSEVTPFATVWDRAAAKKHSVTGEPVFPCYALLDPELTLSLPY
ncbi:MAG: iron-containing alcohol dehydrogenase, partial [Deltaproteobacteria bacterium]|nr:iron-containing alcohol dehydrogenase [Deltaproteobacteria bacterium]